MAYQYPLLASQTTCLPISIRRNAGIRKQKIQRITGYEIGWIYRILVARYVDYHFIVLVTRILRMYSESKHNQYTAYSGASKL
jgi:hypothetical protein